VLLLQVLVCIPRLFGQPISFLPPLVLNDVGGIRYPIPVNGLVTGDFNRDGRADLLALNSPEAGFGQTALTVSLGNGDGTFQPIKTLIASDIVISPVVADFNGDGNPDVAAIVQLVGSSTAASPYGYYLYVLLGNGDGTFRSPLSTALPSPVTTLITADFNRDGHPDLILGQTVLLGNGDGTFRALTAGPDAPVYLSADFNHDGIPDLLLVLSSGQPAVALGAGDGTFGKDLPIVVPFPMGSAIAGDFNEDGHLDLAISPTKAGACVLNCSIPIVSLGVLRGNGDGTFQAAVMTANSMGPILAAADMNQDGKLDLIVGNSVVAGVGDGTFRFPVFFGLTTQACMPPFTSCQVTGDFAAVVADFNGDGLNDVAEASNREDLFDFLDANVAILLNDSPGDGFLVTGVSSPSYKWPTGATSTVTAFGMNLASVTASAPNAASPPTTLGGIRVHFLDRSRFAVGLNPITADELAPLFYVSPTQINFEISTTDTFVYVSIEHVGSPSVPKGMIIPVQPIQADLYTLNASGLAAATAVQISPSGSVIPVSVTPINVSSGQIYLSLYGTGFDSVLSSNVACTIAGVSVQPTYSGPQLQIPGFDQINLLLPASLTGTGDAAVQCSFGPATPPAVTNTVHVTIQ
jgi:uncharacterized protein (TIGR03437 family)